MTRLERLFSLVLELQSRPLTTASRLAGIFQVSDRTIYRDIGVLIELGLPIRGEAGLGYQLKKGYFLPPLAFTPEEAFSTLLGLKWLQTRTQGSFTRWAVLAASKVEAGLSSSLRRDLAKWEALVDLVDPVRQIHWDDPTLRLCQKAVTEKKTLTIHYQGEKDSDPLVRTIEPRKLFLGEGVWYLEAYCRLRTQERVFRLDRIEALEWHGQNFTPQQSSPGKAQEIIVELLFSPEVRRRVKEILHWSFQEWKPVTGQEEDLIGIFKVSRTNEIIPWILSFGPGVKPLSPPALKDSIRSLLEEWTRLLT